MYWTSLATVGALRMKYSTNCLPSAGRWAAQHDIDEDESGQGLVNPLFTVCSEGSTGPIPLSIANAFSLLLLAL